ncbi:MAG: fructose-1,6-bisphosphatase [Lachnospiraceae bacterium]|nr:fructose-1,6-bisphosphatase [Lachnospiraceae bacterium]
MDESRYLKCLSELFPDVASASQEIINLQSILNLPKGTEHYISDIHGEYEAFSHVLKNGSGAVRKKIDDVFGHTLSIADKKALATLIYYPKDKLRDVKAKCEDMDNWYHITIYRLIDVCRVTGSKYTRSKLRKAMPPKYAYVIEELITEKAEVLNKENYYDAIVNTIIEIGQAEPMIIALCNLIQRLVIDHLHVIGDIFDRGPAPDRIMDALMEYHSLDIQWGNHDIEWLGAAAGQPACIANVIRNTVSYGNLDLLEDAYGINLLPLASFAMNTYRKDPCEHYKVVGLDDKSEYEKHLAEKMLKSIAVIQIKLEGQLIMENPWLNMESRLLLKNIDWDRMKITVDGVEYDMCKEDYPTIDREDPYKLTKQELNLVNHLKNTFLHCERLQKHANFLLNKGGIYKVYNHNLLYHGCVPLNEDGTLREVNVYGKMYKGKALYDILEEYVRKAFFAVDEEEKEKGRNIMWFIWCSPNSPLFGKSKMAVLEKYFVEEKAAKVEKKDHYYTLLEKPEVAEMILKEFGADFEDAHIINGHVPVHLKEGENPVRCGGKVIIIDGGFAKPYQKVTGIAGYTLIYNSYGMSLAAHEPFVSPAEAVKKDIDIISNREIIYQARNRQLIKDTDNGREIQIRIDELKLLLEAYRNGKLKEKR